MRAGGRPARRRTANRDPGPGRAARASSGRLPWDGAIASKQAVRDSEEHTSELQSQSNHVCRLLLETKRMSTIFLSTSVGHTSCHFLPGLARVPGQFRFYLPDLTACFWATALGCPTQLVCPGSSMLL